MNQNFNVGSASVPESKYMSSLENVTGVKQIPSEGFHSKCCMFPSDLKDIDIYK